MKALLDFRNFGDYFVEFGFVKFFQNGLQLSNWNHIVLPAGFNYVHILINDFCSLFEIFVDDLLQGFSHKFSQLNSLDDLTVLLVGHD